MPPLRPVGAVTADPVGVADIAARMGVRSKTVSMWRYRGLLPDPRWRVSGQPVWDWLEDVAPWARETGRLDGGNHRMTVGERDALRAAGGERLREALEFYADPDTYFAVLVVGDAPCGEFADDFSEHGDADFPAGDLRPGKRAREALGWGHGG